MAYRESQLQKEIVSLLSNSYSGLNVSEIARELGRHRSSVSRSVAVLKEREWVHAINGRNQVCSEIAMIQGALREEETARKMIEAATSMSTLDVTKGLFDISTAHFQDIAKSVRPLLEASVLKEGVLEQYSNFYADIAKSVDFSMVSAAAEMAQAASLMAQQIDLEPIFSNISYMNKCQDLISGAIHDDLLKCVSSYSSFLDEAVAVKMSEERIERVTASTSDALGAVSYSVAEERISKSKIPKRPVLVQETELDVCLARIHPRLVQMRQGAWQTFKSSNEDKNRQACHSMRELLRLVLKELAPGQGKRKEKIETILGSKTEAELVEDFSKITDRLYKRLCAVSHAENDKRHADISVEFVLANTQNVLAEIVLLHFTHN
ncbi:MAG: helix-turn-helix domain-containing protein [Thermoleophilia bacterium]|nr:helix-turn-helix domain-containing protein [Thermoleophilia bacterium]